MSTTEAIRTRIQRLSKGKPFTSSRFLKLGSRAAVDKTLSRLVEEGEIERLARGVFVRPKKSRFIGTVMPEVSEVVEVIAKSHGETIQVHGAEAARRFKLSTQMPTSPVFYTSGPSRSLRVGNITVKLMHTTSHRRLQFAGKKTGLALSALWYLGKESTTPETIIRIKSGLSPKEFEALKSADVPAWMSEALNSPELEAVNG
jgi:hypothetical protein